MVVDSLVRYKQQAVSYERDCKKLLVFIGDVANMGVGMDKELSSNAGIITHNFTYRDSSGSATSKNVYLSVYVASSVNAGGEYQRLKFTVGSRNKNRLRCEGSCKWSRFLWCHS